MDTNESERGDTEWINVIKGNQVRYTYRVVSKFEGPNRKMRRYNNQIRKRRMSRILATIKRIRIKEAHANK